VTSLLSKDEFHRYSRHIILPQFGVEGQTALKNASVLVVGAGGLGVPILLYLAAAGVGEIAIVDYDTIDFTNLQRQVIYKSSEVGQSKAEKAKSFITEQNPEVKVQIHKLWINSSNALDIIGDADLIIDGTDNFPTRYLLNDAAVIKKIPYVYGSIYRFEGQVSVFNYQNGPNYRDLFPDPPAPEIVPNCSEGGVLGVLPGIVGSMQALESIKIITGIGEVLSGQLLTIDTLNNQYRTFKFKKRPNSQPIVKLIDYDLFCNPIRKEEFAINSIEPLELLEWQRQGKSFALVDVREEYEFEIANLGGILIPLSTLDEHLSKIPKDIPVVLHCRSGKRSGDAIRKLQTSFGYQNLINLEGGLLKYASDVDNSLTVY
jgi:adenylyltransferase/sulfurtransferase